MSTLVINGLLFAAFLIWAICAPAAMRRVVEGAIWLLGALLIVEIVSGLVMLAAGWPLLVAAHRWAAHLMVIIASTMMGASLALLIRHFRRAPGAAILFCLVSFAAVALVFLASFTGYLGPFAPGADQETKNRFFVLHVFIAPILLALLVPFWIAAIRCFPRASKQGEAEEQAPEDAPPPNDNPYASPRGD